jgi:sugar transferase (PEP-CTERM/EpsH1 system associated)
MTLRDARPLIVHIVYRFAVGGLENGVVNLINCLSGSRWRHAILSLTEVEPPMRARIQRSDVQYLELRKRPGHLWRDYPELVRMLRELQPAIVHTRNLAALEAQVAARLAGVPVRIHGEHGWDVRDPDGRSRKFQLVRRAYRPFVQHYVALSRQIEAYLTQAVGVPVARVSQIYNGVDAQRFRAAETQEDRRAPLAAAPFSCENAFVVGTVGRLQAVKDQKLLVQALAQAVRERPAARDRLRLVIVGDGSLRGEVQQAIEAAQIADIAWLAGEQSDVPAWLRALDIFVLPSLSEGISNTILEAMASGLPVVATRVGGNAELIDVPATGELFTAGDAGALAAHLLAALDDPARRSAQGAAGRRRIEQRFTLDAMVASYESMYDRMLARQGVPAVRLNSA